MKAIIWLAYLLWAAVAVVAFKTSHAAGLTVAFLGFAAVWSEAARIRRRTRG